MILYLDASALVKRYVSEPGSEEILRQIEEAEAVGTSGISRAEVAAALAKAARLGLLPREDAQAAYRAFCQEWTDFVRLPVGGGVIERAADLAWEHGLRAFHAVQLAAAVFWQGALETPIFFASFDRRLWSAASAAGLIASPDDLPGLLDSWKRAGGSGPLLL
jgi:predicted nucleic acid-binding protein